MGMFSLGGRIVRTFHSLYRTHLIYDFFFN